MNIRRITRNDKNEFISMTKIFYSSEAVLSPVPSEYHEATFNELMRSDEYADCYIFEQDNTVLGYALLAKTFSQEAGGIVVWLEELYVKPEYRSRGVGKTFFDWMFNNIPASRYRLETEPENKRAAKLYSKMGFENLGYEQMVKNID